MKRLIKSTLLAAILGLAPVAAWAIPPVTPFSIRQSTSVCSTGGAAGTVCSEPTITLPANFSNPVDYACTATCEGPVTGVPVVEEITKAAASPKIQVVIGGMTGVTASCTIVAVTCSPVNLPVL